MAPWRIETGRYERLDESERICPICNSCIENEAHAILECQLYEDVRTVLFNNATNVCPDFSSYSESEKMKFIFTEPKMIRISAKNCLNILQKRASYLYT